ncbi:MAG: sigma-70 family RNA polymerase sigma factor [Pseudanabaenaceae cyanobacterium SKYGB_i_bin29]|nr:sigma-70 family RNA polymerase sigma factor [Pseudanabaenaceae cyanobacterium SKYG29]MDW8421549.1 sigma-70 family RNA polymerase sigma factor [Pseudanabaenaceae cyanobacterium SKYGB_i_bin29]
MVAQSGSINSLSPVGLTDGELIHRSLGGDTHAFRLLYQRHHPKVRSLLFQMCGEEVLDDLVQEVFLRAWRGLRQFRGSCQFSTWLYRIAWNVATDQRRSFAKRNQKHIPVPVEGCHHLPDPDNTPSLQHLHYQQILYQGLDQLSPEHRAVIVLHDLEEVPQKEIAAILKLPIGTVKSRLFHARQALRQYLISQGVEL